MSVKAKLIFGALLSLILSMSCWSHPQATDTEIANQLDIKLKELSEQGDFSGTIILAKNGNVFYKESFGVADRDNQVTNTVLTRFNLASLGKLLTVVGIAQLIDHNQLSLESKLGEILPEWVPTGGSNITVQQLMQHTSGFGSYFQDKTYQAGNYQKKFTKVNDFKNIIKNETLAFKPGSKALYSNSAYIVLGAIIEKVSGKNYYDYISQHILSPLGMNHTDFLSRDNIIPNMSIGYYQDPDSKAWKNNNYIVAMKPSPAGGVHSTVDDVFKLSTAVAFTNLLSEHTRQLLLKGKVSPHKIVNWAITPYGQEVTNTDPYCVGKGGYLMGNSTQLDWYPDSGYQVIVLSNAWQGAKLAIEALGKIAPTKFRKSY